MAHEKSQVNFWYVPYNGDFAWLNYLKGGVIWTSNFTPCDPTFLDSNGYPNSASSPKLETQFQVETLAEYSGNWVLTWTGTVAASGFTFSTGGYSNVSGSLTNNTTRRCVFQFTSTDSPSRLIIFNVPAGSILTKISIVKEGSEETRYLAGEIFGAKFLEVLQSGNFGSIRFLDWLNPNFSMETYWNTRKPVDYVYYGGPELRTSTFAGDLTLSGKQYTCATPSGWTGLVDKARVSFFPKASSAGQLVTAVAAGASNGTGGNKIRMTVGSTTGFVTGDSVSVAYFSNSPSVPGGPYPNLDYICTVVNSTTIDLDGTTWDSGIALDTQIPSRTSVVVRYTLKVGTTAAKFMNLPGGNVIYDLAHRLVNGWIGEAVYDADIDCWCCFGSGVGSTHSCLSNGVPPEICIALANKVNMSPWVHFPHLSMDPQTDYAASLIALCRDTLNPGLVPRFECGNEVWNTGFAATHYAINKGTAFWGIARAFGNPHEWYGKVVSKIGQTVSSAYSADRTKYRMMCGWQTGNSFQFEFASRLTADKYVTVDGGSAASNWATHCCIANYFTSSYYFAAEESTWAAEWEAGDATVKAARLDTYLEGCRNNDGGGGFSLPYVRGRLVTFVSNWPAYYGKVMFYEGGYSPDVGVGESATVRAFRMASKARPKLGDILQENYADMIGFGGLVPSCYIFSGGNQIWPVWDPDIYVSEPPQWTGIKAFNATAVDPPATPVTSRVKIKTR